MEYHTFTSNLFINAYYFPIFTQHLFSIHTQQECALVQNLKMPHRSKITNSELNKMKILMI